MTLFDCLRIQSMSGSQEYVRNPNSKSVTNIIIIVESVLFARECETSLKFHKKYTVLSTDNIYKTLVLVSLSFKDKDLIVYSFMTRWTSLKFHSTSCWMKVFQDLKHLSSWRHAKQRNKYITVMTSFINDSNGTTALTTVVWLVY